MFLLFIIASAFSSPFDAEWNAATTVAAHYAGIDRPISVGCDTDPIAVQVGLDGWSPLCSHGTLTEVSKWLVSVGATEIVTRGTDHKYGATYRAMERERKRFSNWRTVLRVYLTLKPIALSALEQENTARIDEIRVYITTALLPAFAPDVPSELRRLYATEALAYEQMLALRNFDGAQTSWNPEYVAAYDAANLAFGKAAIAAGFHDPLALQWRFRREREGGAVLVAAYHKIFSDFAHSIDRHGYF